MNSRNVIEVIYVVKNVYLKLVSVICYDILLDGLVWREDHNRMAGYFIPYGLIK